jgi:Heparinase II/III-like protein
MFFSHNLEHHNHNDCGSYLINIDGVRLIAEIGAPEYNKDFFGPNRYRSIAARSLGHSLPVINGWEQSPGGEYRAKTLGHAMGPRRAGLRVDATGCYSTQAGCRKYVRALDFDKRAGRVVVRDDFVLSTGKIEVAVISLHPIRIEAEAAVIEAEGICLRITPEAGTALDRVEIHPYRLHEGADAIAYRLVLAPLKSLRRTRLGIVITADKKRA